MALTNRQKVALKVFGDSTSTIFNNDELDQFLSDNDNDIRLAAADAALAHAGQLGNQAYRKKTGTLDIDATKLAENFRALAKELRTQDDDEPATAIAEIGWKPFGADDIEDNLVERNL